MPVPHESPRKSLHRLVFRMHQAMLQIVGPIYELKEEEEPMVQYFKKTKVYLEAIILPEGWFDVEKRVEHQYFRLLTRVHRFCAAARKLNGHDDTYSWECMRKQLSMIARSAGALHDLIINKHHNEVFYSSQTPDYSISSHYSPRPADRELSLEWSDLCVEEQIHKSALLATFKRSCYDRLQNLQMRLCLLCLSVFPDNAVLKKRGLIYWWIGEGIIKASESKTAEEVGDEIFEQLISEGLITAVKDNPSSPIVSRCRMNPWIRDMLVSVAREADFFEFDPSGKPSRSFSKTGRSCLVIESQGFQDSSSSWEYAMGKDLLTVFNVSKDVIEFKYNWLSKLNSRIAVLQLGRWQYWPEHYIEVEIGALVFKGLGSQKLLRYLCLRGVSRISTLPSSISGLVNLEIFDLKACNDLETLPDVSSLRKLTHLDMSECYLLEAMPNGISKLTSLQVLKGFFIGNSTRNTSKLKDLASLKKLRRLSINLGREAVVLEDEFDTLQEISDLCSLTITWGASNRLSKGPSWLPHILLPESLQKLDLRGIPLHKTQRWLKPSAHKLLKKLYIMGGELNSFDLDLGESESWKVEILRLRNVEGFNMGLGQLKKTFPCLRYLERLHSYDTLLPKDATKPEGDCNHGNIVWSNKDAAEEEICYCVRTGYAAKEDKCSVEDVVRPEESDEEDEITPVCH